jgi:3-hydroxybutyrate dehydrogenase
MQDSKDPEIASSTRGILVTGAGSGVGRGLCQCLARRQHRLVCTDLRMEAAQETVRLVGTGVFASAHVLDVTNSSSIAQLLSDVCSDQIDVVINNAGLQHVESIETFPEEKWDQLIDVMLKGTFLLTRALLPRMREHGFGRSSTLARFTRWSHRRTKRPMWRRNMG